jgi:hypothetical protein
MSSDQKLGIGLVIFCVLMWFYTIPFQIVGTDPKFFPRLIIFFILVPGILLIFTRRSDQKTRPLRFRDRKDLHKALSAACLFLIYIALIDVVGYFTTSFLAIAGFLYFFGQRDWRGILLVPTAILFFVYVVIERILSFPLPKGYMY